MQEPVEVAVPVQIDCADEPVVGEPCEVHVAHPEGLFHPVMVPMPLP